MRLGKFIIIIIVTWTYINGYYRGEHRLYVAPFCIPKRRVVKYPFLWYSISRKKRESHFLRSRIDGIVYIQILVNILFSTNDDTNTLDASKKTPTMNLF